MDKDNKVLLAAVLVILVALVAFNFGDITGKAVESNTVIAVSPTSVSFGEYDTAKLITIKVSPGKDGVDTKMHLYREKGTRAGTETVNICTDYICYDETTLTYRLGAELEAGRYYFQAEREKNGQVFKSNIFAIEA